MKKTSFIIVLAMIISCETIDNTSNLFPDKTNENSESSNRDGISITVSEQTDDSENQFLCSNGLNTGTIPFTISPSVLNLKYEFVSDIDVEYEVNFDEDGACGNISLKSTGNLGKEPFTISLRVSETGEHINPIWSNMTTWSVTPAYLVVNPVLTYLPATESLVELQISSNISLDIEVNPIGYIVPDSIVWEDSKCTFYLNDNHSINEMVSYVTVSAKDYPLKSCHTLIQRGYVNGDNSSSDNDGSDNTDNSGDGTSGVIVGVGDYDGGDDVTEEL